MKEVALSYFYKISQCNYYKLLFYKLLIYSDNFKI